MNVTSSSSYPTTMSNSIFSNSSSSLSTKFANDLLSSMDSDSSGGIDVAEFSDAALALSDASDTSSIETAFSSLDTNQDGNINVDELASSIEGIMNQQAGATGGMPPPPPPPSSSSGGKSEEDDALSAIGTTSSSDSETTIYDAADTNNDGTVSLEEALAYQQSMQESSVSNNAKPQNGDFMQSLLGHVISQYATEDVTTTSALNLSA
ncbi:EF-hand domain-containing protein [Sulfurospirillum sp. 1612]|uniref:EF-hand domain-containing protein n=1 Tax=Sulfurospirillum sp. 1612 TaxID=3094835 RepID=UPI002F94DF39